MLCELTSPGIPFSIKGLASLKLFKRNLELMFEEVDHKVSDDEALLFELKNALESKYLLTQK